jgi:hypothetical protein
MDNVFVTSFCNFPHSLKTGRPIGHECYVLPPRALAAEQRGDFELANQILASSSFRDRRPVKGKRMPLKASLSDNRYDKPFKHLRKHSAYLVTMQDQTSGQSGMWDVTPEHGDRAVPKGIIEKSRSSSLYHAFLYNPSYAARYDMARRLGEYRSLDEAIAAIVAA